MRIYPLSEGSFSIDQTKVFIPFDTQRAQIQDRPKGSMLVEIQPFVVITEKDIILLDTGLGYMNAQGVLQIHDNLMANGINPSSVTKVFMSHLHKDHAGGMSYIDAATQARYVSFPYATYYVQKRAFELAMNTSSASYIQEQFAFLTDFSKVVWLDDDQGVIDDTIHYLLTGGHCPFHQVVWIKENDDVLFFGADVAPQLQQLKSKFVAKYDMDGKLAMEWRQKWWEQGQKEGWEFAFYHDIRQPLVKINSLF
jgi:glyoxylase-like metal-dependent hydrolase (beta-lactamase superfamily II)